MLNHFKKRLMKKGSLPAFSEKFRTDHGYEFHKEFPEILLKIYKNKKSVLAVNFENTFGSIHVFRNQKHFDLILDKLKEDFTSHLKKGKCCELTDQQKRQIQQEKLQSFLEKKYAN